MRRVVFSLHSYQFTEPARSCFRFKKSALRLSICLFAYVVVDSQYYDWNKVSLQKIPIIYCVGNDFHLIYVVLMWLLFLPYSSARFFQVVTAEVNEGVRLQGIQVKLFCESGVKYKNQNLRHIRIVVPKAYTETSCHNLSNQTSDIKQHELLKLIENDT